MATMITQCSETVSSPEADIESKYSQIIDFTEQIVNTQESNLVHSFQRIDQLCTIIDQTFKETKSSCDYLLDMNALASTTQAAKNLSKNVNSSMNTFNPIEFAHKLLEKYQNERGILDFNRLHKYSDVILQRTHFNPILLNTFVPSITEIEQKKRTIVRREKDKVAEKKISEKVASIEKTDPTVDEIVSQIYKCLDRNYKRNNERPIGYFQFVLHPTSFSKTIENVFHTSFLVRDNRAKIDIGEDELPTIQPYKGKTQKENSGGGDNVNKGEEKNQRSQMAISLTPVQHETLVNLLGITSPMISPNTLPAPLSTVKRPAIMPSTKTKKF